MKKLYNAKEAPIKVFGLPMLIETGEWRRLPDELMEKVPTIRQFGSLTTGARIGFRTDAEEFTLRCKVKMQLENEGSSWLFSTGFNVYAGERSNSRYLGHLCIMDGEKDWTVIEKTFNKGEGMEDVIIFLASQVHVESCEIIMDEKYKAVPPTPYRYEKPVIYYGSSITAGGAASRAGNSYVSLLSRWLDTDYINFGFPGNARGELAVAEYIKDMDMSVFVYDYDHNAPTAEDLRKTHKPFFDVIRKSNPDLPIILMSRPCGDFDPDDRDKRRQIVLDTYNSAIASGDSNVWFADGKEMFDINERHACSADLIHPTDFGFMCMARYILPILQKALEN